MLSSSTKFTIVPKHSPTHVPEINIDNGQLARVGKMSVRSIIQVLMQLTNMNKPMSASGH